MLSYSGIEPIAAEMSGGQFLTPVQTLAATLIFARWAKMQIDSRTLLQAKTPPIRVVFLLKGCGNRKDGPLDKRENNSPVDCCLVRGRFHSAWSAGGTPVKQALSSWLVTRAKMQIDSRTLLQTKTPPIRLGESLGRLFGKLQNIAMGRDTVLDYVRPETQAVVDDLNELDNEEYEL